MERVYTIDEVMDILKVTQRTVYNYIKTNKLKAKKGSQKWYITETALNEFLGIETTQETK